MRWWAEWGHDLIEGEPVPDEDGQLWKTFTEGKLKAYLFGVRMPVRFVKWWVRRFSK